jgi:hypothetical protein
VDRRLDLLFSLDRFGLRCPVFGLFLQHPDGQELEDPVLDVAKGVVVLLEDLGRPRNVQPLLRALGPRQLTDGLEVGADDLRLHALGTHPFESAQLSVDLLAGGFREFEGLEFFAQFFEVFSTSVLTELALNGLELLAQEHLALTIAQFLLDLRLDVLLRVQDRDLLLDMKEHLAQAVLHRQRLEQSLGIGRFEVEVTGHEVGETPRLLGFGEKLLHRLLGHPGAAAELGGALAGFAVECCEGGSLGIDRRHLVGGVNRRHQVLVLLLITHGDRAVVSVEQQPHS